MGFFNNKLFKIIFNIFKFLVLVLIFLYIAFIFVQRISNNKSVGGYRVYTIATSSMKGVYDVNDVILVKDCNTKKLKVGDDIVYVGKKHDLKDKIISHRIIEIKKDKDTGEIKFITKGVANDIADPPITEDQILGKVDRVLPIITPINHIIKSQAGFFLLVFCPLVIVIVLEILHVVSEIGEDKQKIERIGQTTIAMERIMDEERKEEEVEDSIPIIERVTEEEKKLERLLEDNDIERLEEESSDVDDDKDSEEDSEEIEEESDKDSDEEKFVMVEDEEEVEEEK